MAKQTGQDGKDRLIPLSLASELYGFNQGYLATLARSGRLKARKLGSIWVTTPHDVETYIRSRKNVGVFREDIEIYD